MVTAKRIKGTFSIKLGSCNLKITILKYLININCCNLKVILI